MDGRVLLNQLNGKPARLAIEELEGWTPGSAEIAADGAIKRSGSVSLVVPTFFNSELKHRSLHHLIEGVARSRSVREIVFVSSDGESRTFDDLRAQTGGRPVRVVESDPHNRGKSRNAGAAAATGSHLLFLDDDMLVRDWRSVDVILSRIFEEGRDCALFPRRHYAKFPLLFDPPALAAVIAEWRRGSRENGNPFLFDPLRHGARDLPMLFCFPGCFMLIRRAAYRRMGGFKEDFVGWGFEDTEFGQRAMRELSVLNLFRRGEPLLHIDHPVSPYKSDEHNANYQKFHAAHDALDVNLFCRRVFRGDDFQREDPVSLNEAVYNAPFHALARRGVPLQVATLQPWCRQVARQRLARFLSPLPRFIVLHGSRAQGKRASSDDFDVLCLYQGAIQEFHVSPGAPRVEMECADMHRFEHIAAHPAIHSYQGPMELAKVANARLLWGDSESWREWSGALIRQAVERGWCFWIVFGLGLRAHAAKYGPMVRRYFRAIEKLREHAGTVNGWHAEGVFESFDDRKLSRLAREALTQYCTDWRERLAEGAAVFELQVPEVWTALHRLREAAESGTPIRQCAPGNIRRVRAPRRQTKGR